MNLDSMNQVCGEWLKSTGPEVDIVISSRIRLAAIWRRFLSLTAPAPIRKSDLETLLRDRISKLDITPRLNYHGIAALEPLDRQFLIERQLISREISAAEGPRGVAFDDKETVSVMVNEEDQLRLQVIRSGLSLEEAWQEIDRFDDAIEQRVTYAFHEEFGYLTACPTNVGTGMCASVLLHLPALGWTKQIEKVFRALQKINLAVRGLYGEGSRASGDFYQISNQVTLGKAESAILDEIREVIPEILKYERQARSTLVNENKQMLQDRVSRAFGTLSSATMMTSEETMDLLSVVRLGIHLGLLEDLTIATVNELFLKTQPAHLQKLTGNHLDSEERNAARARYLRNRL